MIQLLKKIFGTAQSRLIKRYAKIVTQVNECEKQYQSLSDEEVSRKTEEFRKRLSQGELLDDLLPEAYAIVKNVCRRMCGTDVHVSGYDQKWDMIPYDVQILGAIAMHYGSIAEMQTGEGKTLTASLPLYLNALTGKPVHLVTVNDYLAKRDCEWIGSIFRRLGLTVTALTGETPLSNRKEVYAADIVYGTASEFGFDYLRDNSMATSKEEQCQRKPYFAIIDEVDSILIDEARTPLIISGPTPVSRHMYEELKEGVALLVKEQRDHCTRLASEARKSLDSLGLLAETEKESKLSKEEAERLAEALKKLWLVGKGTPCHRILKKIKENPDLRAQLDQWETYYFSEQCKEERLQALAELFIIVDERANEYELTDKGIQKWTEIVHTHGAQDFVMLDLGDEYLAIDSHPEWTEEEKLQKKIKLREEDARRKERAHNLRQLFRAHLLMEKDVDYIVAENKIIIIDENTGRPQPGRRFSDGLHQAIEAKESVPIQRETQTYATITLQNFFRMYEKIAGMTGTAITEANEFKEIYHLEVLEIPTYCNCKRKDADDKIYMSEREKYLAILHEIKEIHEKGRPILIGTESVEISEKLSRILRQNKLEHTVLNAKNHAKEAEIIASAGQRGAITLATNMAGRGTDIKLSKEVVTLGGLHVIGTTRHHSRRIDRQLRGRSGRLGDPGSSQFFVSFEDSLMRLFASPRLTALLQSFRPPEGEPISAKVLNRAIETAQKRIEQRNYTIRKHTLEYDDVMNKQRKEIYSFRNDLLYTEDTLSIAKEMIDKVCSLLTSEYFIDRASPAGWNPEPFRQSLMSYFPVTFEKQEFDSDYLERADIEKKTSEKVVNAFERKITHQVHVIFSLAAPQEPDLERALGVLREVVRNLMVGKIDDRWQEHLLLIDYLRADIHLRSLGQKDPLLEFKHEAFRLFDSFSRQLMLEVARDLFRFEMVAPERRRVEEVLQKLQLDTQRSFLPVPEEEILTEEAPPSESLPSEEPAAPIISDPKIGRNDLCPCGSGKKHKKCCQQHASEESCSKS